MHFHRQSKQIETQEDRHAEDSFQPQDVATSCSNNTTADRQRRFEYRKCVSPMTYSQKLYQSHVRDIAEEFDTASKANSLEEIKKLLNKVFELDESSSD